MTHTETNDLEPSQNFELFDANLSHLSHASDAFMTSSRIDCLYCRFVSVSSRVNHPPVIPLLTVGDNCAYYCCYTTAN